MFLSHDKIWWYFLFVSIYIEICTKITKSITRYKFNPSIHWSRKYIFLKWSSTFAVEQSPWTLCSQSKNFWRIQNLINSLAPICCRVKVRLLFIAINLRWDWYFVLTWYCRPSAWSVPVASYFSSSGDTPRHRPAPNSCIRRSRRCVPRSASWRSRITRLARANGFADSEISN